jgi:hypothetical protein
MRLKLRFFGQQQQQQQQPPQQQQVVEFPDGSPVPALVQLAAGDRICGSASPRSHFVHTTHTSLFNTERFAVPAASITLHQGSCCCCCCRRRCHRLQRTAPISPLLHRRLHLTVVTPQATLRTPFYATPTFALAYASM